MTMKLSMDLGLPASPATQNAELFQELLRVYNAVNLLASMLDQYTGEGTAGSTIDELKSQLLTLTNRVDTLTAALSTVPSVTLPAATDVAFLNGWHNLSGGIQGGSYYKDSFGIVHLQGLVTGGVINSPMFILPDGFRPLSLLNFPVLSNGAIGGVNISILGEVNCFQGNNAYVTLDGITFRTT